ncbi:hypothetical protein R1sor_006632 [Riccia sorocarpa]|uniref:Uncharacterized protein n=1 Tax=Riccia sorocarpa TaxID=122646 RepID=A0ABD3HS91_9MARC
MIRKQLAKGTNRQERKYWSAPEALLLLTQLAIPRAPLLTRMLKQWYLIRKFLRREGTNQEIPATASIQQLAQLATLYTENGKEWATIATRLLASLQIREAIHLRDTAGRWKSLITLGFTHRRTWSRQELSAAGHWDRWLKTQIPTNKPLQQTQGWAWTNSSQNKFKWVKPASFWTKLLYKPASVTGELNRRWAIQDSESRWKERWLNVWKSKLTPRIKLWWWKLYHQGFLTGRRVAKFSRDQGICHNRRSESRNSLARVHRAEEPADIEQRSCDSLSEEDTVRSEDATDTSPRATETEQSSQSQPLHVSVDLHTHTGWEGHVVNTERENRNYGRDRNRESQEAWRLLLRPP